MQRKVRTSCSQSKIIVDELPIHKWTTKYKKELDDFLEEGKIKSISNQSVKDNIEFTLEGLTFEPTISSLKLFKSLSMNNLVLLKNGLPHKYATIAEYLEDFFQARAAVYILRKERVLVEMQEQIDKKNEKLAFVVALRARTLIIENKPKAQALEEITQLGLKTYLYGVVKVKDYGDEGYQKLLDKIAADVAAMHAYTQKQPSEIWIEEIEQFLVEYYKQYPGDRRE